MRKITFFLLGILLSNANLLQAQGTIKGHIRNSITSEPVPAVSISIKNAAEGTYSDDKGRFRVNVRRKFPVTLIVSSIGFETRELLVQGEDGSLAIDLVPTSALGDAVVVSASRTVQKKLASPVTIEQISNKDIINSPQINYYDMLQGLKGVDVTV